MTNLRSKSSAYQVATFITCIGPAALSIHSGLPFENDEQRDDIETVIKLWDDYCIGKTNIIYERYRFNNRAQEQNESVDQYLYA